MADKKQYVNLDPTKPEQLKEIPAARAGRYLKLVASVSKKRSGVTVMFELKSGAGNQIPDLDPGNFTAKQIAKLPGLGLPSKVERRAVTDNKGKAEITFILSDFGGDEFQVRAWIPGKGGKQLFSDKYTVWKRFYYQVSRFDTGPRGAGRAGGALPAIPALPMGAVTTEFEARSHNIEIVQDPSTDLITRRCEVLADDPDYTASASEGYDRKREPVSLRMVMVNQIATSAQMSRTFTDFTENVTKRIDLGADLWIDERLPVNTDWLVTAEWGWKWGDYGAWKPLAGFGHYAVVGPRSVDVTLPAMPARGVLSNRTLQLRLTYRRLAGSTNGVSWYNAVWIANENMHLGARGDPAKLQTTIHEIGHFLKLVPAAQSTHYVDHDHQGPHCLTGLGDADRRRTSYGGLNGTCVMFGENAATRTGQFCAVCDPSVREARVVLSAMPAAW